MQERNDSGKLLTILDESWVHTRFWGVAKASSVSWVAKFKGDKNSECKLSNGWSQSYKVIKLLLSIGKCVVAKLQGDKSASHSSMELYYPWISGPLEGSGPSSVEVSSEGFSEGRLLWV